MVANPQHVKFLHIPKGRNKKSLASPSSFPRRQLSQPQAHQQQHPRNSHTDTSNGAKETRKTNCRKKKRRRKDIMSTSDHRTRPHRPPSPSHSRSRSRSPDRDRSARHSDSNRHHHHHRRHHHHRHHDLDRDEERRRRHHRHSHRSHRREEPQPQPQPQPVILPFQARELSKRHLHHYEPLFAMYLDIQKGIILEDLEDEERKGRWKSFVGKWYFRIPSPKKNKRKGEKKKSNISNQEPRRTRRRVVRPCHAGQGKEKRRGEPPSSLFLSPSSRFAQLA